MREIRQRFTVEYSYPIRFTERVFDPENPVFSETVRPFSPLPARTVFVLDAGLCDAWPDLCADIDRYCRAYSATIASDHAPLIVPGGERAKNDRSHVDNVLRLIHQAGICRHSYVVAVGGGAVLDMAGFAAATAHRGVRLIRIPTTALAQNDSGVGVKNSVNAFGKKNFLGAFAPPDAVLCDSQFLATLDDRDWRCGVAEAVKVALVKDASFFGAIEACAEALASRDMGAMRSLVQRCAELHLHHIAASGDPFEMGSSRPLDFGHWSAHKLEQLTGFMLRHGEAVAIGIALDSTYSYLAGMLPEQDWRRILTLLTQLGFALHAPEADAYLDQPDDTRCLLRGLAEFKEHLGGRLTITLLDRIGHGVEVNRIDPKLVAASIARLREIEQRCDGMNDVTAAGSPGVFGAQ